MLSFSDGKSTRMFDEVEIAYLPKNVARVVEEVEGTRGGYRMTSNPPPQNQPQSISLQPLGQRNNNVSVSSAVFSGPMQLNAQRGAQGIRWAARDDNDDQLVYTVYIRGVNETSWK